jgi:hypothetical protein
MSKKFSYATQTNTSCNQNSQLWYYVNAVNKYKIEKNPIKKAYYYSIINYYLNGNIGNI